MMRNKTLGAMLSGFALIFLVATTPNRSYALELIEIVTKERAKTLGLEIRSSAAGPDAIRVELEFEIKGDLKSYHRVALEMHEGDKLLASSTLKEEESKKGHVIVSFAADRAKLGQFRLKVVTLNDDGRNGHVIKVKDFVDLEKLR
jgi:hypothetical protein